jgi:uncharacterized membrane protein
MTAEQVIKQIRDNAEVLLLPTYRTGTIPDAAIAGELRMAADQLDTWSEAMHAAIHALKHDTATVPMVIARLREALATIATNKYDR